MGERRKINVLWQNHMSKCTGEMVGSLPHDEVKTLPVQKEAKFGRMSKGPKTRQEHSAS